MANYNVHAGHSPYGTGGAYGAVGILNESTEARKVKDLVIAKLQRLGHTVYDCTCDEPLNQQACLNNIVKKCNRRVVDLDISIHLNSGRNDYNGDGSTGGVEVFSYDNKTSAIAARICENIHKHGYRNRGAKINKNLYVLRNTRSDAILIECAFVDDKDDAELWDVEKIATAIVEGITGINFYNLDFNDNSPYLVKIDTDFLNVRSKPSIYSEVVKTVKRGQVFTIVNESQGWGKLKSGSGWINLKYTKKV